MGTSNVFFLWGGGGGLRLEVFWEAGFGRVLGGEGFRAVGFFWGGFRFPELGALSPNSSPPTRNPKS